MKQTVYYKIAFGITLAGVLFSGYMSGIKFLSDTCAFNEPCPYFLGFPACYFGFAMFLALFLITTYAFAKKVKESWPKTANLIVALMGTLFAGYFTANELPDVLSGVAEGYSLGLPTCSYGLIFFVAILILSAIPIKKK
ncbi:MAG: hypothetical protein ABH846_03265 [Patescibacteria group bacterium]